MLKYIYTIAITFFSFQAFAQQEIKLEEIKDYIGDSQWIVGKIKLYKGKPEIVITSPNQIYDVVAPPLSK